MSKNKEIVETIINTSALALTSYGVLQLTTDGNFLKGLVLLFVGMGLEFAKYYGRKKKLWR